MQNLFKLLKSNSLLLFIILFASIIRLFNLSVIPPSLNWDEVSHGYNAYSILKTGEDEWGVKFPTIFRAYGDYKLPVYVYITALSEFFFGLNEFAVRLPSAVSGVLTVLFTYLLAARLFNQKIGLTSALLVAIEPWTLFLSRGAFEANFSLMLIVSGIYFFIIGLKSKKLLPLSTLLLGLSLWTYNSARVFTPLFSVALMLIYRQELSRVFLKNKKVVAFCMLIFIFFTLPMFYQLFQNTGLARYSKVAILDEGAIQKINEKRGESSLPSPFNRVLHNKATYFASDFSKNWISHYSFNFLFFNGGSQYQFNVPGYGLIYQLEIPFIILGLILMFQKPNKNSRLVLLWLIIGPIASSITREAPHTLRAITILPIPMILSANGIYACYMWTHKKNKTLSTTLIVALTIALMFSCINYFKIYSTDYKNNYSWSWQYGYKQAINYTKANYQKYDQIIISKKYGEPHEFFLFYWPWNPEEYRLDPNLIRFSQSDWFWVDHFNKFYFVNDWDILSNSQTIKMESGAVVPITQKTLLITNPGNHPPNWNLIKTINFLDNSKAFELYEKP